MKKLFTLAAWSFLLCAPLAAQTNPEAAPRKWDSQLQRLLQTYAQSAAAPSLDGTTAARDTLVHVIIRATDSHSLADSLRAKGYAVTVLSSTYLTAQLPLRQVPTVSKSKNVRRISASRRHRPLMNKARAAVGVDKLHAGEGLTTPYKGKGVVVAIIDQGFQYNHIAFNGSNHATRILSIWDQNGNKPPVYTLPQEKHDGMREAMGHGTHVASIAAGSDQGNGLQGMAPEADLVLIPSTFEDADILNSLDFIDSLATSQGKPWVTNMSFGITVGPHDGSTDYDQAASAILQRGKGRVITAAMGNDADDKLHAYHRFTQPNEKVYLLFEPSPQKMLLFDIWGTKTDSLQHLKVTPYVHEDGGTGWKKLSTSPTYNDVWDTEINPNNKRESYSFASMDNDYFSTIAAPIIVVEIEGNPGDDFHAWVDPNGSRILSEVDEYKGVKPDNHYCVGEGAASIPGAVAVGAYVSTLTWNDYNGNEQSSSTTNNTAVGEIATFSSRGPWLGAEPKPTIVAPGSQISAAYNRFHNYFYSASSEITSKIKQGRETFYYGVMEGTSMASPAVAGIIALWLEANPQLSTADVHEILRKTAIKDAFTDNEEWTKERGFGKINAYEGLKLALEKVLSISAVQRSAAPVSILRTTTDYRLLFGSREAQVQVEVFSLNGTLIERRQLGAVSPGTETLLPLSSFPVGISLLRITTPRATVTHKLVK